jgi:hypothetical protein
MLSTSDVGNTVLSKNLLLPLYRVWPSGCDAVRRNMSPIKHATSSGAIPRPPSCFRIASAAWLRAFTAAGSVCLSNPSSMGITKNGAAITYQPGCPKEFKGHNVSGRNATILSMNWGALRVRTLSRLPPLSPLVNDFYDAADTGKQAQESGHRVPLPIVTRCHLSPSLTTRL